ncbi:hypothetical protein QMT40_000405 [Parvibaculaceae bacterium PLY_AMNH_Bact1]|nr:hypothetical protein QMT40_000405 [Parvibaculaceae bacterium PLY_AMNH_Bact1]
MSKFSWTEYILGAAEAIPSSLIGAAVGSGLAMWFAISINRQENRRRLTQSFIDEMLGREFLVHRIALGKILARMNADPNYKCAFARGFWFPGVEGEDVGEMEQELNWHQHFEVVKGWARRLAQAERNKSVDMSELVAATSDAFTWMNAVLIPIADEVNSQVNQARASDCPEAIATWTDDVRHVSRLFTTHSKSQSNPDGRES